MTDDLREIVEQMLEILEQMREDREAHALERRELLHAIAVLAITLHVEKLRKKFLAGDFSLVKDPDQLLRNLEAEEDGC